MGVEDFSLSWQESWCEWDSLSWVTPNIGLVDIWNRNLGFGGHGALSPFFSPQLLNLGWFDESDWKPIKLALWIFEKGVMFAG